MSKRLSADVQAEIVDVPARLEKEEAERDAYDVMLVNGFLLDGQTTLQSWGCHPSTPW